MIIKFQEKSPKVTNASFIAENATIIGDVTIGKNSSVWFGAVLRGDTSFIQLGNNTNVQDNAIIHVDPGTPVKIGSNVTIGHASVIHGATIDDNVLIGMGATIMNGAHIGKNSIVAAGALVLENTVVPPGSLISGVPGKIRKELSQDAIQSIAKSAETYVRNAQNYSHSLNNSDPNE